LGQALQVASNLGGILLVGVIYCAMWKYLSPLTARGRQNSLDAIARLAARGPELGADLGLEVVNRYESNLINTHGERSGVHRQQRCCGSDCQGGGGDDNVGQVLPGPDRGVRRRDAVVADKGGQSANVASTPCRRGSTPGPCGRGESVPCRRRTGQAASAAFLMAVSVAGMPLCAASVRSAI